MINYTKIYKLITTYDDYRNNIILIILENMSICKLLRHLFQYQIIVGSRYILRYVLDNISQLIEIMP